MDNSSASSEMPADKTGNDTNASGEVSELSVSELSRRVQDLEVLAASLYAFLESFVLSDPGFTDKNGITLASLWKKFVSEGVSGGGNAARTDVNAPRTDGNAPRTSGNALRTSGNALREKGNALRNDVNALQKEDNALRDSGNALQNDGKDSRKGAQRLPWTVDRPSRYKDGGSPLYVERWRKALPPELVEKLGREPQFSGGMRLRGLQSVAATYLVLYHYSPCSRSALTGRLQLHPDHVKRYLSRMKKAGHLIRKQQSYEYFYSLTEEGRKWVEGVVGEGGNSG